MKVDIYKNIRKKCYSIKSREKENYGRVIDHKTKATIRDVKFVVSEKGRDAVRQTKQKNVHAVLRGYLAENSNIAGFGPPIPVFYNPYAHQGFIDNRGKLVESAKMVELTPNNVYGYGVKYLDK